VGVEIDESRGDDHARRVEHAIRVGGAHGADLGDPPVLDPDIRANARHPAPVDEDPPANRNVEERQGVSSLCLVSQANDPEADSKEPTGKSLVCCKALVSRKAR
jgi:hypothetical protein